MKPFASRPPEGSTLRAIKWFTLTHALGLSLFALLMGLFFWYVQRTEYEQQRQALYRDVEWTQQSLRLHWREAQEALSGSASEWATIGSSDAAGHAPLRDFLKRYPDALYVARIDGERRVRWMLPARGSYRVDQRAPGTRIEDSAGYAAFIDARESLRSNFSPPAVWDSEEIVVELQAPVVAGRNFNGTLAVGFSLNRSLALVVSPEIRERYQIVLADEGGNTLLSSSPRTIHDANLSYELSLDPPGHGIRLRAFAFEHRPLLVDRTLLAAVIGLSIASLVSLVLLWRHARRRLVAEVERDRLFTLSPDPLCVLDAQGALVRGNPAFEQFFGARERGTRFAASAHPDDAPTVERALRDVAGDAPAQVTLEARFRASGVEDDWRWLQWSIRRDPDARPPLLYAVARDITQRRDAERALAEETAFRRAMEDSILTGMRAFDLQGRIIYVNRAFCSMVGYPEQELLGAMPPYPYWPEEDRDRQRANLEMVLRGEAPASGFETRVKRKDGTVFDTRMYVSPLVDRAGEHTGWMTSITDITEPKRIREELAAAHERFTTVLEELDAAVSVAADAGDGPPALLFANRMYRQLFGDTVAGHAALLRATEGQAGDGDEVFHDERGRWFEVRSRQIRWVDGSSARMLAATDVTRRREAEERHRQQDLRLQQTSRLVTMGEMASSLAHELNQPLTAIANYCMGIAARVRGRMNRGDPVPPAELLEPLAKTAAQAERAGEVIRRIRNFVKRSEPERRRCEVGAIVADAIGLAEIDAKRHGIRITVLQEPGLPALDADPILIEQVLVNLLKNGIESMRDTSRGGPREVSLRVRRAGEAVEFEVTDHGAGLSDEVLARLFEPFFSTKPEGMGMGLNICRSIVESHGGRLQAENLESGGCRFLFTLPRAAEALAARAA